MHAETYSHNNEDQRTQLFRRIYLSLYWKGCVWEGVGDWTELQHIDPTLMAIIAFLSCSPGLLSGGLGAQPLWDIALIPASSLQLIWRSELQLLNRGSWGTPLLGAGSLYRLQLTRSSCASSYIIVLRPLNSARRQSVISTDIIDRMHLLFT